MNKCVFTTRFKECYKEKGYTQEDVAEKLGISLNGLKNYLRTKNDKLPPLDLLKRIAELLDVDTAYLLGEIDCKKNSQQAIYDITGLTKESASIISKHSKNYSAMFCSFINHLATTIYLEDLCDLVFEFEFMDNETVTIESKRENKKQYYSSAFAERKVLKAKIIDLFDKILDELFDTSHNWDEETGFEMSCQLLEMIDNEEYKYFRNYELLYKEISYRLEEIRCINPYEFMLSFTPNQIVHEKRYALKNMYLKNRKIEN